MADDGASGGPCNSRKRPHSSVDGDDSDGNPSSTRPLTLLAGCALNQGQPSAQQNAAPLRGMNHAMIHNFVHAHPTNMMPAGGQSAMAPAMMPSPRNVAAMQAQPTAAGTGSLLRPFGMSPQELLNYAVLVNIVHQSIDQGNAAISQLTLNCSQVMAQNPNRSEGASVAGFDTTAAAAVQMRGHNTTTTIGTEEKDPGPSGNMQQQNVDGGSEGTSGANSTFNPNTGPEFLHNSLAANEQYTEVVGGADTALNANQAVDAPGRRRVLLFTPEDEQRLSTQQCWLRKQIEAFPASARDVRTRGRNRLVDIGQVGIQCIHCKQLPQEGRGKGSSYFPASIKSIYQSAQNMLQQHFKEHTCPLISRRLLEEMREAGEASVVNPRMAPKAGKSRSGGGKAYWEASEAHALGLVDTTVGIRYSDDLHHCQPLESIGGLEHESFHAEPSVLTTPDDKAHVTDFCYLLMSQFDPYCCKAPTHKTYRQDRRREEWHSDSENEETLPSIGVVCKFCRGESGRSKGIFLSSKADTMSRNKNLARMYNHLMTCAPDERLKTKLVQAKNIHLPQSDRLKKGWKKAFFVRCEERLLDALDLDGVDDHNH
ncbi:hypothetical protein ACHAXT_007555 [Thalassiosira profunda]